ncbi:MAG TPA: bifunctional oligoribonuclease/PAP phosphatase NrnA [Anaerolineae bacterium]|nr:bifunctional oligoribonuclease/PAP phosphatase NrnA [Anaerolineae bacterium]
MSDSVVLSQVVETLKNARSVFIAAHIMPDGDCVGSQLALAHALRVLDKRVTLSIDDRVPESLNFLVGVKEIAPREPSAEDVFVYIDGSDSKRYGKALNREKIGQRPVILIDHHATNEPFGDLNLVDMNAASTAEIVYDLIRALDVPISTIIAQVLLTGIVTDTLGFRTTSTTPETLEKATMLVRCGGSIPQIIDQVYNRRSYNALRVVGYALANAKLDGEVIWSAVDFKTQQALGLDGNGTGGIVNQLLTVAEARIAFFIVEKEDGRGDLSIRSRDTLDISRVAQRLGGGGHKQAAGAMLPPPFSTAPQRVLDAIREEFHS